MTNALESINAEDLTDCAFDYISQHKALSKKAEEKKYELPCGCEEVTLGELVSDYQCSECDETYFYSFCWKEVVQSNDTWHCKSCGTCRDWREWHCDSCNICNYGASLPCESCGEKSPYA